MLQPRPRRASAALVLCLFVTGCASTRSGKAEPGRVPTGGPIYVTSQGAPEFKVARTNPIAGGAVAAAPVVGALGALVLWGVVTVVTKAMDKGADRALTPAPEDSLASLRLRLIRNLEAEASLSGTRWIDGQAVLQGRPMNDETPGGVLTLTLDKWGLHAHKSDSEAFLPVLGVTATLLKQGERLWQAECEPRPEQAAWPLPTLAELAANQNARLYRVIERAMEACADELTARLIGRAVPEPREARKREVKAARKSLGDVETIMLGTRESPGLAAGRFEARFSDLALTNPDLETLQRLLREAMIGPGESELRIDGTLDGRPFEAKLERNSAGRARLKFEGLHFAAEPEVDTFLAAFTGPGLRRVDFDGEVEGRRVRRSRP